MVTTIGTDSDALVSLALSVSSFSGAVTGLTATGRVRAIQEPFSGDRYWDFVAGAWVTDRNAVGAVRTLSEYAPGFYTTSDKIDVDTARSMLLDMTGMILEYEFTGAQDGVANDLVWIEKTATQGNINYNYSPATPGSHGNCGSCGSCSGCSCSGSKFAFDPVGRPIIYSLVDQNGAVDLSEFTLPGGPIPDERIKVVYTPPGGGAEITVIGQVATPPDGRGDGLDGRIIVNPGSPFFTTAGLWRARADLEFSASTRSIPIGCFRVTTPESA